MSHRWMKFWPGDWKGDAALRMCGLAARGLWIECITIMHDAEPYGHLVINGRAPTDRQLAAILGATERDITKLMAELEEAGVYSRTAAGIVFSRRMVRDNTKSLEGRENVSKRWTKKGEAETPTREPNRPPNRGPNRDPNTLEAEADTEAEKNPLTPRKRGASSGEGRAVAAMPELPPWLPPEAWATWCRYRKGPKWTADAQALSLRKLGEFHADGHDPRAVIEQSIASGWTGLFAPKGGNGRGQAEQPSKRAWAFEGAFPNERDHRGPIIEGDQL